MAVLRNSASIEERVRQATWPELRSDEAMTNDLLELENACYMLGRVDLSAPGAVGDLQRFREFIDARFARPE
jgi:hypothetical protein